jgi:Putative restriction endonuclease
LTSDFGVDLGPETVRYPDFIVAVASGLLKDLTATAPVLVAEVLSPSSATYDLGDKAAEYLKLTSCTPTWCSHGTSPRRGPGSALRRIFTRAGCDHGPRRNHSHRGARDRPYALGDLRGYSDERVGWVERSETDHLAHANGGFASLNPPYDHRSSLLPRSSSR